MKTKALFSLCFIFLAGFIVRSQDCVDFESLTPGTTYGNGVNSIGEVVFTENEINVSVEYFEWTGGGGMFGTAEVQNAFSGFGTGQVMWTSNINLKFDFVQLGIPVKMVTFEYSDMGGHENISVNGNPIFKGELDEAPNQPGVTINVGVSTMPGGKMGLVTIAAIGGTIESLMVGGQEFALDNICAFEVEPGCVDFESVYPGNEYGNGINSVGEIVLVEHLIPVSVEYFEWNTGGTFGTATVDAAFSGFGTDNIMRTNNINLFFDFAMVGFVVDKVTFEYADMGGHENFSVNGEPIFVGELKNAPVPPGISINVNTSPMPGGEMGFVELIGEITTMTVGGQEFWLDNICPFPINPGINEPFTRSSVNLGVVYPNPGAGKITIPFTLDMQQHVKLQIIDLCGKIVNTLVNSVFQEGNHNIEWDGTSNEGKDLPGGIYFCRLETTDAVLQSRILLVK